MQNFFDELEKILFPKQRNYKEETQASTLITKTKPKEGVGGGVWHLKSKEPNTLFFKDHSAKAWAARFVLLGGHLTNLTRKTWSISTNTINDKPQHIVQF